MSNSKRRRKGNLTSKVEKDAQTLYNELWEVEKRCSHQVAPNPVSLEKYHMTHNLKDTHLVAEKNDGVRCLLLLGRTFDSNEEPYMLQVFRNRNMKEIDCVKQEKDCSVFVGNKNMDVNLFDGTLVDGEYVEETGEIILFDAVAIGGYDVKGFNLHSRLNTVKTVASVLPECDFRIRCKKFHPLEKAVEIYEESDNADGLILMPIDSPVRTGRHQNMFKWKVLDQCTIDLGYDGKEFYAIGDGGKKEKKIPFRTPTGQFMTNAIYELAPSFTSDEWKIVRHRTDKVQPNHIVTIKKTLNTIRDNISLDDIIELC